MQSLQKRMMTALAVLLVSSLGAGTPCPAMDQDDGIAIDDNSQQYEDISSSRKNFSYLTQRARSKAAAGSGDVVLSDAGALNSVILESGAEIKGDVVIIDESSGDKTVLSH
ncbi:MAG: hypothetical protein AB7E77_02550 [Desulfobulbus sp.]